MRKRLYFLLPSIQHCKRVVEELQDAGLSDHYMRVLARSDISLTGLPQASMLQKTELAHGLEWGLGLGGMAGALGGLLAITFPPAGLAFGGGALVLATTLAGASFGTVVSALVAAGIPNHEIEKYQDGIRQGQLLLMVDVPSHAIRMTVSMVEACYPRADIGITNSR
jgi:hypothetical protein